MKTIQMVAALGLATSILSAPAQSLVVPNYLKTNDAAFGSGTLWQVIRNQQVYHSSEFPTQPIRIKELRFRPDRTYGSAFSTVISNLQVNLSTTTNAPYHLSSFFAQNVGADDTVVFSGSLAISSLFTGSASGPKDFDIVIPTQAPFVYDPAQGHLLVDIRNMSGSGATYVGGGGGLTNGSRAFGYDVNSPTADFVADGIDALEIVYEPVLPSANSVTSPTGFLSWWRGESNTLDSIGSNHGTIVAAVGFAPGKVGAGFKFDGAGSFIQVPHSPTLNFSQGLTVEFWFNNQGAILDYSPIAKRSGYAAHFGVNVISTGLGAYFNDPNYSSDSDDPGSGFETSRAALFPITNQFHHFAASWRQASSNQVEIRMFLDNALVKTRILPGVLANTFNSEALTIGAGAASGEFFTGIIDEVSLYDRALDTNEIAAIYNAGSAGKTPPAVMAAQPVPVIYSFAPAGARLGEAVTLLGTNFSDVAASNIVYFGAVRAAVTLASPTSLTVVVPSGATYAAPSVTVAGLTGQATSPFLPTFAGGGAGVDASSFAAKFDLSASSDQIAVSIGDMDGDGRPDVVVANAHANTVGVYRNISTNGDLLNGSFAPRVDYAVGYPAYGSTVGDMDGDGKLDIVVANNGDGAGNTVSVLRNTSTPGVIDAGSFAARVDFTVGAGPIRLSVGDLDGDGRLDLAMGAGGGISVLRNTGTPGSLTSGSFAPYLQLATGGPNTWDVEVADVDGDGKRDLLALNSDSGTVSIFRNISSPGSLTASSFASQLDIATGAAIDLAVGDLDGDGRPELVVPRQNTSDVAVFRNTSAAGSLTSNSFAPALLFVTAASPQGVAIGDVDGDAKPDLAVSGYAVNRLSILRNTSVPGSITAGSFAAKVDYVTGANPHQVALGDLNGDGRPDAVVTSWGSSSIAVLKNTAVPTPAAITQHPTDRTVVAGSPVAFVSAAAGSSPLAYQWLWNGTNVAGATNATYSIAAVQEGQAGLYSVRVTNLFGVAESSNALLTVLAPPPVPVIYSFAPIKAKAGEPVQLVGTNFSDFAASNIVYFGAVRALVVAASPTSLTVVTPSGATFAPPSVTVAGLSGQANAPFLPTYLGTEVINNSSFSPKVDFTASSPQATVAIGDLDGDGKPDLLAGNYNASSVSVYRNISSNGVISATSFAPRVTFSTSSSPLASLADVDGDGKLDILVANNGNGIGNTISILRNTSTPGVINNSSFAARVNYTTPTGPLKIAAGDLDGDGRTDLAVSVANSRVVSLFRNIGTPGIISSNTFAARVDLGPNLVDRDVALADLDGDGKLDIVVTHFSSGTVSLLRNIATRGSLTTNSFAPKVTLATGSAYNVTVGDLDGDGKLDIALDNRPSSIGVLRNLSTPGNLSSNTFAAKVSFPVSGEPYMVAIGDVDGDGKPDLAASIMNANAIAVLSNLAAPGNINSNSFAARVLFATGTSPRNLVLGDLDADGRPDLAAASLLSSFVSVLKNTVPPPGPPSFVTQPVSQSSVLGDQVGFTANVAGALAYQWQFNGDNLAGQTNSSLILSDARLEQAGSYTVVATNGFGPATSTGAVLTVTVPGCVSAPDGLVAWWSGNGDSFDSLNTNHGVAQSGISFAAGKAGQAFQLGVTNNGVRIPAGSALDVGTGDGMTIECWINLATVTGNCPLVEWNDGVPGGTFFGTHLYVGPYGAGSLYANLVGAGEVYHQLHSAAGVVKSNVFQHIALTYDRASGVTRLFCNGAIVAEQNLGTFTHLTGNDLYLGKRPAGDVVVNSSGLMDEVCLYNRALATNEIAALYAARGTGKCPLPPIVLNVTPPSLLVNEGESASFSALATGTPPLSYQWQFNGTNIASQTNTSLVLPAVQAAQSGNYTVVVTNLAGSASSNAVLTVIPLLKVPVIFSFAPGSAKPGDSVQLIGTNFSDVAASNLVYFGAVRAAVTLASPTSLTVIVPVGATYAPPTVTVGGLTAQASASFTPTFPGGGSISNASFAARVNLETGNGPVQTVIADLDGDGKPDLAVADDYAHTITLYRNVSSVGTLTTASFESRVVVQASAADYSPYMLVAADVDGDGKLDLVTTDLTGNTVSVFRNVAVPGSLSSNSFAPFVSFPVGAGPRQLAVADLDADGRPEIVTANYDGGTVSVLRNTGSAGQITAGSFAPVINLVAGAGTHGVAVADLDGDGKPDLVTANNVSATLSLFRNIGSGPLAAGSFAPEVQITATASAHFLRAADLDGDGKLDLILTAYLSDPLTVFRNQSTAGVLDNTSFAPGVTFALSGRGHTVSAGDLNGDGKVDLAVDTELGDSVALLQNLATPGSFTSASLAARVDLSTGWNAWGSSVGDLDGDGRSDVVFANAYEATISICRNLMGDNHAPIADASATASLVVSLNGSNAVVTLDGSRSSDPDSNTLTHAWFIVGTSNVLATGVVGCVTLPLGTNHLTLVVNDGQASSSQNFTVEVISVDAAFDELRGLVLSGHLRLRAIPLLAALRAAENALDRDHINRAIARLHAFQFWVRVLVQPDDPTLAAQLIQEAQAIIVALGPPNHPAPHVVTISSISVGANGRPHLRISGESGRVYIVEASTNTAHWVPLGEATETGTNVFEFDDASTQIGPRFYRVVAPE